MKFHHTRDIMSYRVEIAVIRPIGVRSLGFRFDLVILTDSFQSGDQKIRAFLKNAYGGASEL